ncbi:hypothetical protein DXG01_009852, partial [Tephrocybe rancida]
MTLLRGMGMWDDLDQRVVAVRINDASQRKKVQAMWKFIYELGFAVNSKSVETILKPLSLSLQWCVNALSAALGEFAFNHYQMLIIDILHEWEVGVWKSILIHLIRLVHKVKGAH